MKRLELRSPNFFETLILHYFNFDYFSFYFQDIAKINAASHSSSRGWFGFASSSRLPQPNVSLAEQFIRFLEKESLTTSHSLPVQVSAKKVLNIRKNSIKI